MIPRVLLLAVALLLLTVVIVAPVGGKTLNGVEILTAPWKGETIEYLNREILVGLKAGMTQSDLVSQVDLGEVDIVRPADRFGFLKLRAKNPDDLFALIERIAALPAVRYAEPNMVDHAYVIPNDPDFIKQWHYDNTGQVPPGGTVDADIDAPEGWDISTGGNHVKVGVLDSGIPMQGGTLSHPDLDDPIRFIPGIDISNGDSEPADDNGHGTHVSGTIAAESNNGIGVAGVAWNVKIVSIKVFDRYGSGSHENFRDGCIYAVDNGCKVINYSGGGSAGATKEHGVAYADTHNVVVCAAAGNNWQGSVSWPGAYSDGYGNVICVSSTDHNDGSSPFSSIGPEVTISAPGGYGSPYDADDVWSTFPNYEVQLNIDYGLPQSYGPLAGTSMATPHVSGFAGLIFSIAPDILPDSVRQLMINTSDDLGPAGFDNQFGWGKINVFNALSQMKVLSISHEPLPDTRDTLNDYEVLCDIYCDTTLVADSLLLHYQLASTWYDEVLQSTGEENEYHAFIPAQTAGTVIDYRLFAKNDRGDYDSTDIYDFRVIDYAVRLMPEFQASSGAVHDTVWYNLSVFNDGVYIDTFAVRTNFSDWTSKIWDVTGNFEITTIGPLIPEEQFDFLVSVEVPVSLYGDMDSVQIRASSKSSLGVVDYSWIQTLSSGQPLAIPFIEEFESPSVNIGKWLAFSGVEVNDVGLSEPTEPYSLDLNGDPDGGDDLASQPINLAGLSGLNISYFYQRTGGGETPDEGDDLFVEYMNNLGQWSQINHHLGGLGDMTTYEAVTIGVPADGYHSGFRLRFRNTATEGAYDDWFIDDISVDWGPAITANPGSYYYELMPGDSAEDVLVVDNAGPGWLSYSIAIVPDYSVAALFRELLALGQVNPPHYTLPDGWQGEALSKGGAEGAPGTDVLFNAGGPDDFGYIWVDSDEPNGPSFEWVDILATGTDITSGLDDDNFIGPFPIGFDFPYYSNTYDEFYLASNGFIGFGPTTGYGSVSNIAIPNTATPNNFIAWCWDDLDPTDFDNPDVKVVYQNAGGGLVIQFYNYPEYSASAGDVADAEIILYPDGGFKIQYLSVDPGFDVLNCAIGNENVDGDDGLGVVNNSAYLHDELAVEFFRPVQWLNLSSLGGELAPETADTIEVKFLTTELDTGYYHNDLVVNSNDPDPGDNPLVIPADLHIVGESQYTCGDANGDELVNISDAVALIGYIFDGGTPPEPLAAGDVNCDSLVNISDAVYLISYIFGDGPEPCAECS